MKMKKLILVNSLFLLSFFYGCASFRAGNLPEINSWPPEPSSQKKSISIVVSGEAIVNGDEQEVNARFLETWREQTVKAYQESNLFSNVNTDLSASDLRAEIKIMDKGEANLALAFITGLTLYVIPSKATDEFTITTTLKDNLGNSLGTYEKSETVDMWQQLFLIFLMPSNFPLSVAKDTIYDLNRATINDISAQKHF